MDMVTESRKQKSILLVDDLRFMRSLMREILEKAGYTICAEAEDGLEGLACYEKWKPQLVILDITMPKMDGLTALKKLFETHDNACVLMCSALNEEDILLKAIALGAGDFVIKPFTEERLVSAVDHLCRIDPERISKDKVI